MFNVLPYLDFKANSLAAFDWIRQVISLSPSNQIFLKKGGVGLGQVSGAEDENQQGCYQVLWPVYVSPVCQEDEIEDSGRNKKASYRREVKM